jgi:hypothetical protein
MGTLTLSAGLVAAVVASGVLTVAPTAVAAGPEGGTEYSYLPGKGPKAHGAGVIKVVVKGLPRNRKVKVRIERRAADYSRLRLAKMRFVRTATVRAGKLHLFRYATKAGHYYVTGRPISVKGTRFKAHRARVLVNREHGVRVRLRYYGKGHKHFPAPGVNTPAPETGTTPVPPPSQPPEPTTGPTAPSSPPASSPPPPAIAYPSTSRGNASSFDRGQGAWRQCTITWSFDPGPTARLGGDPQTEVQLLRGILNSVAGTAGYRFREVAANAELTIQMVDTVAAIGGVVPSGVTLVGPPGGAPFTSATIKFNAGSLLGASVSRIKVRQNLYAHEIGHALGLNHVTDPAQIMSPVVPNDFGWGAGDVAVLKAMPSTCS